MLTFKVITPITKKPTKSIGVGIVGKRKKKGEEEEKKEETKTGFTQKPSNKFTSIKTASPFTSSGAKFKSKFAQAYSETQQIPCRINHGSVINRLQWDTPPSRKQIKIKQNSHITHSLLLALRDSLN